MPRALGRGASTATAPNVPVEISSAAPLPDVPAAALPHDSSVTASGAAEATPRGAALPAAAAAAAAAAAMSNPSINMEPSEIETHKRSADAAALSAPPLADKPRRLGLKPMVFVRKPAAELPSASSNP